MIPPCPSRTFQMSADWLELRCATGAADAAEAVNAITGSRLRHHPIFAEFSPWNGTLQPGMLTDFIGFTLLRSIYCNNRYVPRKFALNHAIRFRACMRSAELHQLAAADAAPVQVQSAWPVVAEEYFEYVDVLSSVSEYCMRGLRERPFTFVELGAGYGHWTFAAHRALWQKCRGAEHAYLLVDVVDNLEPLIRAVAANNSVVDHNVRVHFGYLHAPNASGKAAMHQSKLWSRTWLQPVGMHRRPSRVIPPSPTLDSLLAAAQLPCVIDMIDIDIDGGEYGLFGPTSSATIALLTRRVRRIHFGLHDFSTRKRAVANRELASRFERHGWIVKWLFHSASRQTTPWGMVAFGDGVLSLVNPAMMQRETAVVASMTGFDGGIDAKAAPPAMDLGCLASSPGHGGGTMKPWQTTNHSGQSQVVDRSGALIDAWSASTPAAPAVPVTTTGGAGKLFTHWPLSELPPVRRWRQSELQSYLQRVYRDPLLVVSAGTEREAARFAFYYHSMPGAETCAARCKWGVDEWRASTCQLPAACEAALLLREPAFVGRTLNAMGFWSGAGLGACAGAGLLPPRGPVSNEESGQFGFAADDSMAEVIRVPPDWVIGSQHGGEGGNCARAKAILISARGSHAHVLNASCD